MREQGDLRRKINELRCFRQYFVASVAISIALAAIAPQAFATAAPTVTVRPSAHQGRLAVFKAPAALAPRVVAGRLDVGDKSKELSRRQIATIVRRRVLSIRAARRPRPLLVLRLRPKGALPAAAERIAVAPAVSLAIGPDPSFDPRSGGRLYSPESPFNQPLPADPALAPDSARLVQGLARAEAQKGFVLTVDEWTVPTYFAGADTPTATVQLGGAPPQWGMAPHALAYPPGSGDGLPEQMPSQLHGVPIPPGAVPDPSLDAHMTVVDYAAGCEYDLYGAHRAADGWHAVWANSTRIDGTGVYPSGLGAKASGFASLAGLVWPEELRKGRIDHALFFAYPFTRSGGPVSPATASDGRVDDSGALPEGARLQLDPNLDLDQLGLMPYQRTIAEAMQTYGIVLGDTGGAFGLYAVGRQGFPGNPYEGLLPDEDFPSLSPIPTDRFRVLDLPAQKPNPPQRIVPSGCGTFG